MQVIMLQHWQKLEDVFFVVLWYWVARRHSMGQAQRCPDSGDCRWQMNVTGLPLLRRHVSLGAQNDIARFSRQVPVLIPRVKV